MPSQLFTLARKFQAASNGKIYIGQIDKDPTIPENQIQVYLENEDGSTIPVAQPLIINQAGLPVYNGQIAKFVTVEGHSMAIYDSYGAQQFYYPNVLKYDPDQFDKRFRDELKSGDGSLIGIDLGTLRDNIYFVTPEQFSSTMNGSDDWAIAINAALDYMESIGGGIVQLKPKHYFHRTQILVPENCTLRGCGKFSSTISAYDDMPAELNSITSKNNPMNTVKANGTDPTLESFNYINGVIIEDLTVNANATGRHALISDGISELQSCGIKLTSVKQSAIRRCFVYDSIMHCYDVAASNYFDDGNTTHNINGGSYDVLIEDCEGLNSLYDDIFTTHNSDKILIKNCVASNNGVNPYMVWGNNQHGFEIDEGSSNVTVMDCKAIGLMCGFATQGHDTTKPADNIKFIRCHAKDCRWSFAASHYPKTKSEIVGRGITFVDCISENPFNDTRKTYNNTIKPSEEIWRPRHTRMFGYVRIVMTRFTLLGGEGLLEIGYPDTATGAVVIDGVKSYGGYSGIYQGLTAFGLITVLSGTTYGRHVINNVSVYDKVNIPAIRCVDTALTRGITIDGVEALGDNNTPCILTSLNIPSDISNINSSGFAYALIDASVPGSRAKNYSNETEFSVVNGVVHLVISTVPDGDIHPARVGNTAINRGAGLQYIAKFNNNGLVGQWVQLV